MHRMRLGFVRCTFDRKITGYRTLSARRMIAIEASYVRVSILCRPWAIFHRFLLSQRKQGGVKVEQVNKALSLAHFRNYIHNVKVGQVHPAHSVGLKVDEISVFVMSLLFDFKELCRVL